MNHTTPTKNAAWRSHYDVTESQATVIVALIAAYQLGYDGAPVKALRWVGVHDSGLHTMPELQRAGLIEIVGHVEGSQASVWRATARAFRRFAVPIPRPLPQLSALALEQAERLGANYDERNRQKLRDRYRRRKESA